MSFAALEPPAPGLALDAGQSLGQLATLAAGAEAAGFTSVWINVERPGLDLPIILSRMLGATRSVEVGVGVVPSRDYPVEDVVRQLLDAGAQASRLVFCIDIPTGPGGLAQAAARLARLRVLAPSMRLGYGASGPRGVSLAARSADALVLSWSTPDFATQRYRWLAAAAQSAGRPVPAAYLYVSCSWGVEGPHILASATERMRVYPRHRANFAQMGDPAAVGIVAADARGVSQAAASFAPSWRVVLRPIVGELGLPDAMSWSTAVNLLAPQQPVRPLPHSRLRT